MQQILQNNIHILEKSTFNNLQLSINCENWEQTTNIIIRLYHKHIQSKMAKTGNSYQKIDLTVLWFLNTTEYLWQMVLVYFICKMAFDDKVDCKYYCDNCI